MSDEEYIKKYIKYKKKYFDLKYIKFGGSDYLNNVKISELKNKNIYNIECKSNNTKLKNIKIFIKKKNNDLKIYYYDNKKKIELKPSDCNFNNSTIEKEQRQLNLSIPLLNPHSKQIINQQQRLINLP
jgi:lipopolysaccharide export LptBFGC system permease protein LptF